MLETHPYGYFAPPNSQALLLGSFTGLPTPGYDWFYGTSRNQFWPILRQVYNLPLETKSQKQDLFTSLSLSITDIIYQCERTKGTNLDSNLSQVVYNHKIINFLFTTYPIQHIYFTSRFVELHFHKVFAQIIKSHPHLTFTTLPSPSPRYAQMTFVQKVSAYRRLMPSLTP